MQKAWLAALVVVTVVSLCGILASAADEPAQGGNAFMRLKLKNAEAVLDGIAVADFARIEEGADYLVRLSKKAEFQKKDVPNYERYNESFRQAAEGLVQAAKAKKVDRAALAYVRLTMTCVECHNHLRELK